VIKKNYNLRREATWILGSTYSRYYDRLDPMVIKAWEYIQENKILGLGYRDYYPHAVERTLIIDDMVSIFLKKNPKSIIVNLGAGICTRYFRINTYESSWIHIDFPEIGELREDIGLNDGKQSFMGCDLKDNPRLPDHDLLIGEGIFMYLPRDLAFEYITNRSIFDVWGHKRNLRPGTGRWFYKPTKFPYKVINKVQYWEKAADCYVLEVQP
jgi:hypothetical protein